MKSKITVLALALLSAFYLFNACQSNTKVQYHPSAIDFSLIPLPTISEYGFFKGELMQLEANEGVLLYEPSSSLFTDYAHKSRFVWMPEGTQAKIVDNDWQEFDFPDKTILVKNFYYPKADGKQQIVETRLLVKRDGAWDAYPYLWNKDQTDAVYKMTGATLPISFTNDAGIHHNIDYIQPNKNQCKSCHNQNEEFKPIGPKARNLNFDLDYGNGEVKNQLVKWTEMGYLAEYDAASIQTIPNYHDESITIENRAKAYLDANCAYCHNPLGPASTSGLFLTYEETDTYKLGYYKTPVAAGLGAGPHMFDVLPGKADSSILTYRMNSVEPGVMMPELGRVLVHEEGLAIVSAWINQMND